MVATVGISPYLFNNIFQYRNMNIAEILTNILINMNILQLYILNNIAKILKVA